MQFGDICCWCCCVVVLSELELICGIVAVQSVGIVCLITFVGGRLGGHLCRLVPGHLWKLMLDDFICDLLCCVV